MDRKLYSLLFEVTLLAAATVGVLFALSWPQETRLLPVTFGTAVAVMLVALIVSELAKLRQSEGRDIHEALAALAVRRAKTKGEAAGGLRELGYLVAYALAIWLVGFYPATALYLGLYLWRVARFRAWLSALISLAATGALLALFVGLLGTDRYTGIFF